MTVIESMTSRGIIPRAVLYARFSSDNQREESIDAQLRAMREYCKRNKVVIINEYCDHAKSATTDDRPEFQKMIHESKKMRIRPRYRPQARPIQPRQIRLGILQA